MYTVQYVVDNCFCPLLSPFDTEISILKCGLRQHKAGLRPDKNIFSRVCLAGFAPGDSNQQLQWSAMVSYVSRTRTYKYGTGLRQSRVGERKVTRTTDDDR